MRKMAAAALALVITGVLNAGVVIDSGRAVFTFTDTRATDMEVHCVKEGEDSSLTLSLGRVDKALWSVTAELPEGSYLYTLSVSYDGGGSWTEGLEGDGSFTVL